MSEIIQFSAFSRLTRPVSDKRPLGQRTRVAKPALPPTATETAKNSRNRIARRDAWWRADRETDYWRARLDWKYALEIAHKYEIGDSASFHLPDENSRFELVDKWREAVVKQLLTPAPDGTAVAWKRARLAGIDFEQLPAKAERVEQVIADDAAFPGRTSNPSVKQRSNGA